MIPNWKQILSFKVLFVLRFNSYVSNSICHILYFVLLCLISILFHCFKFFTVVHILIVLPKSIPVNLSVRLFRLCLQYMKSLSRSSRNRLGNLIIMPKYCLLQTDNTLRWSFGGFQGARGSNDGKEWYVENIFEELDVPGEWFLDKKSMKLYYYPHGSPPSKVRFV